jgi:hypothetical protein
MTRDDSTAPSSTDLLTIKELARALKLKSVSGAGIRKWQSEGMPTVYVGRLRRYEPDKVREWLHERELARLARRAAKKVTVCGSVRVPGHASAFALKRPRRRRAA